MYVRSYSVLVHLQAFCEIMECTGKTCTHLNLATITLYVMINLYMYMYALVVSISMLHL